MRLSCSNVRCHYFMYRFYRGKRPIMMVADLEILKQVTVKEFNSFVDREVSKILELFSGSTRACCILGLVLFLGLGTRQTVQLVSYPAPHLTLVWE